MATTTTKTTSESVNEIPAIAQKFHEQLVSTVQQGQKLMIDAAENWVKAMSVLPAFDLPKMPGIPGMPEMPEMPSMEAATTYTFDVAADLLKTQREFELQLTKILVVPAAKS